MTNRTWHLQHLDGEGDQDDGGGTYAVTGDHIAFDRQTEGYTSSYTYTLDNNGTLHVDPQPPINPGDRFVWATNPWAKVS